MKKKVWVASPICFVLAAAMLIMALISWFTGHKMVFFIEAVVAVVAILAIAIVHIRFQSYVYTSVKAAKKVLFGKEYDALEQFTMPMAIVGSISILEAMKPADATGRHAPNARSA